MAANSNRSRSYSSGSIVLGICTMEKKASSKPMQEILAQIRSFGDIEVVIFPEDLILNAPIEEWPNPVDVLIGFFSTGFPLDKAEAYVALRQPHCINDLTAQRCLLDRRRVYALLEENGIPHPQALVVERDGATGELLGAAGRNFVEADDFLSIGDNRIAKPFVEKPVDAEDHNICIYYPSSMGGGVKRLFRKVGDQSASYDPHTGNVRRDRSYMYEPFMKTQGTDIKVYTVGPEYAHAEARKSPVLDGVVNRNKDGKEVRIPVLLTPREKEIARRVCLAFGQLVCGFDLLRTTAGSYVIDVNGWSFVKGEEGYYEDAAALLHVQILRAVGRMPSSMLQSRRPSRPSSASGSPVEPMPASPKKENRSDRWQHEELLAVLAVLRHGDRTPKNKAKLTTTRREFIQLQQRWAGGPHKDVKLKSPKQLQEVLDLTNSLLRQPSPSSGSCISKQHHEATESSRDGADSSVESDAEAGGGIPRTLSIDEHTLEALTLISAVLTEGGHFDGIYRKVQIKPTAWNQEGEVIEVLIILKYGGILTPAGVSQAEGLGRDLREAMYPSELRVVGSSNSPSEKRTKGLLRLHATQRHDFKVYAADEGRVQMSAAAFTRGLLDLASAALTPICAALVETDSAMLDDVPHTAEKFLRNSKQVLQKRITGREDADTGSLSPCNSPMGMHQRARRGAQLSPCSSAPLKPRPEDIADEVPVMVEELRSLQRHLRAVNEELQAVDEMQAQPCPCVPSGEKRPESTLEVCCTTSLLLVQKRWQRLEEDLWDAKHRTWNTAKVPDIFDAVKFDLIHHPHLASAFRPLYGIAKRLNDAMVPNEYGHDGRSRAKIGGMVCGTLLRKLLTDLRKSISVAGGLCVEEGLPERKLVTAVQYLRRVFPFAQWLLPRKEVPQAQEKDEYQEAELAGPDPRHTVGKINSPHRRVRTRLYFTSESHIQTLMNVLRYCHLPPQERPHFERQCSSGSDMEGRAEDARGPPRGQGVVCPEVEEALRKEPVFDYLTHVVFRLYEDKRAAVGSPERYRVEVLFSSGASGDPCGSNHTMEVSALRPLHEAHTPLTAAQLQRLLGPFASPASAPESAAGLSATPTDEAGAA